MKSSTLRSYWWAILLQGILMIALSIIIFNNPGTVLTVIAFWLGVIVIITGLIGMITWVSNSKEDRDLFTLFGSIFIVIIGILMISKTVLTVKAITVVFGLLVSVVGFVLISGAWNGRGIWSLWWVMVLLGAAAIFIGIKSIMDIYSGAQNISTLIGISVLISGIGMMGLALLKKKIGDAVRNEISRKFFDRQKSPGHN